MTPAELLAHWREGRQLLADAAATLDDDTRVEWYGPSMGSKSFLTARLMECWAHGQDIVDAVEADRPPSDRLRHIAQLGIITRAWSYVNRGEEPPGGEVRVRLGARWLELSHGGLMVARHARHARKGSQTLTLDHYLEVLVRKPGALPGSLTLAQARESGAFTSAHERFWKRARRKRGDAAGTRALIEVLLLHRRLPFIAVHAALDAVERVGSADPDLVAIEARRITDEGDRPVVTADGDERTGWSRPVPLLTGYGALLRVGTSR